MALSLSLHTRHDASMTISNQDKILKYFEFEKIIGRRYFCFSEGPNFLQEAQTVTQNEVFLCRLLLEFGKLSGFEVLVNTSLNSKGEPILNDIERAFNLFLNSDIDVFNVEGYLFEK